MAESLSKAIDGFEEAHDLAVLGDHPQKTGALIRTALELSASCEIDQARVFLRLAKRFAKTPGELARANYWSEGLEYDGTTASHIFKKDMTDIVNGFCVYLGDEKEPSASAVRNAFLNGTDERDTITSLEFLGRLSIETNKPETAAWAFEFSCRLAVESSDKLIDANAVCRNSLKDLWFSNNYEAAYKVIEMVTSEPFAIMNMDPDALYVMGEVVQTLAANIKSDEYEKYGSSADLFKQAVFWKERAVELEGDLDKVPEFMLIGYSNALSEYAENIIDYKIGTPEERKTAVENAEIFLNQLTEKFPNNPELWLDWGWNEYYKAKLTGFYGPSAERARQVKDKIFDLKDTTNDQKLGIIRVLAWSVLEFSYSQIKDRNFAVAQGNLEKYNLLQLLEEAESIETYDDRWLKDLYYTENRYHFLMGRITGKDSVQCNTDTYHLNQDGRQCSFKSECINVEQPPALEHFELGIEILETDIDPIETNRSMFHKTIAWNVVREGKYDDAIILFEKSIAENAPDAIGAIVDAKTGLMIAMKGNYCNELIEPQKKFEFAIGIAQLASEIASADASLKNAQELASDINVLTALYQYYKGCDKPNCAFFHSKKDDYDKTIGKLMNDSQKDCGHVPQVKRAIKALRRLMK
jgi:hypothetical protein